MSMLYCKGDRQRAVGWQADWTHDSPVDFPHSSAWVIQALQRIEQHDPGTERDAHRFNGVHCERASSACGSRVSRGLATHSLRR